jgi:two-component system, OmpR family, response regulator
MLGERGSKITVLLLADNDWQFGETLCAALDDTLCSADRVIENAQVLDALKRHRYDVILLDVDPPKTDCSDLVRILRSEAHGAVVVLIAAEGDLTDGGRSGLGSVADDRVSKPFKKSEVLWRIRGAIRRRRGVSASEMTNGYLWLDLDKQEARSAVMAARLPPRELALLHTLMTRPGAIFSRPELERRIDRCGGVTDDTIDALVDSLRTKLGSEAIRKIRGLGWMVSGGT